MSADKGFQKLREHCEDHLEEDIDAIYRGEEKLDGKPATHKKNDLEKGYDAEAEVEEDVADPTEVKPIPAENMPKKGLDAAVEAVVEWIGDEVSVEQMKAVFWAIAMEDRNTDRINGYIKQIQAEHRRNMQADLDDEEYSRSREQEGPH